MCEGCGKWILSEEGVDKAPEDRTLMMVLFYSWELHTLKVDFMSL
jgi:hypothetical protein